MGNPCGGGGTSTNTVTQNSAPPQWLQTELQNLGTAGQNAASQPLNQYTGSMVAGFTPDQTSAFSTIDNSQGIAQPFINSGATALGNATASLQPTEQPYVDASTGALNTASSGFGAAGNTANGIAGAGASQFGAATGLYGGSASAANNIGTAGNPAYGAAGGYYGAAGGTNVLGSASPYFNNASTALSAGNIQAQMSPYTQNVVNSTQAEFNNQNAQSQQGIISNAIGSGAFGGDRASVAQGIAAGQEQLAQAPVIANLENTGYQTALQAAEAQGNLNIGAGQGIASAAGTQGNLQLGAGQGIAGIGTAQTNAQASEAGALANAGSGIAGVGSALTGANASQASAQTQAASGNLGVASGQLGAANSVLGANEAQGWLNSSVGNSLANLGTTSQSDALQGASAQLQSGALQQQLGQEQLNVPYEQFLQQQAYPYQQLSWLGGLEEGTAGSAGGTSSTTSPAPSTLSQLGGLGLTGIAAIGGTGGFGATGYATQGLSSLGSGLSSLGSGLGSLLGFGHGGAVQKHAGGGIVAHLADGGSGGVVLPQVPIIGAVDYLTPQTGHGGKGIPQPPAAYKAPDPLAMASQVGNAFKAANFGKPSSPPASGPNSTGGNGVVPTQAPANDAASSDLSSPEYLQEVAYGGVIGRRASGGVSGAAPFMSSAASKSGLNIPQVSSSLFSTPSANVAAMTGGPAGLGTSFNPLAQYAPPGYGPATGIATTNTKASPSTVGGQMYPGITINTGGASTSMFNGQIPPGGFKDGGVVPFPTDRIKRRDDGGDVGNSDPLANIPNTNPAALGPKPDDPNAGGVAPTNWRQSTLTDANGPAPFTPPAVNLGTPHVDPWQALASAGLAMMAGTSPHALTNVGRGLATGLDEYNQEKGQAQQQAKTQFDADARAADMADRAEQWRAQNGVAKESAAEAVARDAATAAHNQATLDAETARDKNASTYNQGMLGVARQNANTNATTSYQYQPGISVDPQTGARTEGAWKVGDDGSKEFMPGMVITKPDAATPPVTGALPAGTTGPDALKALPPDVAATVRQMIEGRAPAPSGNALRSPQVMQLVQIANQVDPSFDESAWQQRVKTRQSFSGNGIDAQTTGAGVQLMNHLDDLDKSLKSLNNFNAGPASGLINAPINWAESSSNPAINNTKLAAQAVGTEAGKLWRGTGQMSEKEIEDWKNGIPMNANSDVQNSVAPAMIKLADGRFDALRNKWQSTMGANVPMPPLFTQSTQEKYDRLSQGTGSYMSQPLPLTPDKTGVDTSQLKPGVVYKTAKGYGQWNGTGWTPLTP